jgi:hypothetical protein
MKLEKIKRLMILQPSLKFNTLDALPESEIDRMIGQIELFVQQKETEQSRVKLFLVRQGLRNDPLNFSQIKARLGHYYSVLQFRTLIEQDEGFKRSLTWDHEPFAEVVRQEQQDTAAEQTRRRQFSAVVKALSTVSVSDCDSNYFLCEDQLPHLLVSHAITEGPYPEMLAEGLLQNLFTGLAKNSEDTAQELDRQNRERLLQTIQSRLISQAQYSGVVRRRILSESTLPELRERVALVNALADMYSPSQAVNDSHFCSLFASAKINQQIRSDLEKAQERQRLAGMTPQQIREENQRVRAVNSTIENHESDTIMTPDGLFRKLRPDSKFNGQLIDRALLWRETKENVAKMLKTWGKFQLDQRIREGIQEN